MLHVVCFLWDNGPGKRRGRVQYTAEHVNRLRAMVERNLSLAHEVVCITDDPEGLDPRIRVVPLWDEGLREKGGAYLRLKLFDETMADLIGERLVQLDLDVVVTDSLDPLFERDEDFVIWREPRNATYNTSVMLMTAGARKEVWSSFDPADLTQPHGPHGAWAHPHALEKGFSNATDQAWISACLYPREEAWTKEDGIWSFKRQLYRQNRVDGSYPKKVDLPADAKIVAFHGAADPTLWSVNKICPWVREHWRL